MAGNDWDSPNGDSWSNVTWMQVNPPLWLISQMSGVLLSGMFATNNIWGIYDVDGKFQQSSAMVSPSHHHQQTCLIIFDNQSLWASKSIYLYQPWSFCSVLISLLTSCNIPCLTRFTTGAPPPHNQRHPKSLKSSRWAPRGSSSEARRRRWHWNLQHLVQSMNS